MKFYTLYVIKFNVGNKTGLKNGYASLDSFNPTESMRVRCNRDGNWFRTFNDRGQRILSYEKWMESYEIVHQFTVQCTEQQAKDMEKTIKHGLVKDISINCSNRLYPDGVTEVVMWSQERQDEMIRLSLIEEKKFDKLNLESVFEKGYPSYEAVNR